MGNIVKTVGQGCWDFIRVVLLVLLLNPIVWGVWMLFAPRSAVGLLYDTKAQNNRGFARLGSFFVILNRKMTKLMPWRSRMPYLVAFYHCIDLTPKEETKLFEIGEIKVNMLSSEAQCILWKNRKNWASLSMWDISDEQFLDLVNAGKWNLIKENALKRTPSVDRLNDILRFYCVRDGRADNAVREIILKYGLPTELIHKFCVKYKDKSCITSRYLEDYSQIQAVKKLTDESSWRKYLAKLNDGLCFEAQMLMTAGQFKLYDLNGKVLSMDVVKNWMNDPQKRHLVVEIVRKVVDSNDASDCARIIILQAKTDDWWRRKLYE